MVESRDGKARQRVLHVATEVLTVFPLETLGGLSQRIVIEHCGDLGVKTVEIVEIPVCVEQPIRIAKHRNVEFRTIGFQAIHLREGDT